MTDAANNEQLGVSLTWPGSACRPRWTPNYSALLTSLIFGVAASIRS